jgi:hypothetical protein
MHIKDCQCTHHKVGKLVMVLQGISVLGFWFAIALKTRILGISADHFLKEFVIFSLITITMHKGCRCCCGGCATCSTGSEMNKPQGM